MSSIETLPLTVHVAADEWAYAQRRLTYLEALLLRLVREKKNIQEWYEAAELAALRLPGLPGSKEGIIRKATFSRWPRKSVTVKGRKRHTYHVANLPARAFDALIARLLDMPEMEPVTVPALPPAPIPPALPVNTAPAWVLPLMRLVRAEGDLAQAWKDLPGHMPFGTVLPTIEEAAIILVDLGLMNRLAR